MKKDRRCINGGDVVNGRKVGSLKVRRGERNVEGRERGRGREEEGGRRECRLSSAIFRPLTNDKSIIPLIL